MGKEELTYTSGGTDTHGTHKEIIIESPQKLNLKQPYDPAVLLLGK